ncbi:cyclin-J-like protein isoform X2 [Hypomesus transpacificus]|nr:cyclin-J-like protein isoform X2 [Hypomesus transpacificus]
MTLPSYKASSPQIWMRRYFADLLAVVSEQYSLCLAAHHLAVYLLDLFMDRYDVSLHELYASALSCLLLACKFEEKEERIPRLNQLNSLGFMQSQAVVLTRADLLRLELQLLDSLGWNLCLPTAAHFVDYYLKGALGDGDRHRGRALASVDRTRNFLDKYTLYFLEVSLQDHFFLQFGPSHVASASIAASRMCLDISPHWTTLLHTLTGYSNGQLTACVEMMLLAHDSDVKQANKSKPRSGASLTPVQSRTFSSVPCLSSAPLLQPRVLGEFQAWRPAGSHYHVQPCQSGLISGSASQATFLPILASGLGTQSHQGPISLQVASESRHGHCLSLPYSGAYLSSSHNTFVGGCFDR